MEGEGNVRGRELPCPGSKIHKNMLWGEMAGAFCSYCGLIIILLLANLPTVHHW